MSKPQTQKQIKEEKKIAFNLKNYVTHFHVTAERENITDENCPLR